MLFISVLIFVARPAAVLLSTFGSSMTWTEKLFLCWMAPRGIVAAAVSSVFALMMANANVPQADQMTPVVFLVIVVTVAVYGLSAAPLGAGSVWQAPTLKGSFSSGPDHGCAKPPPPCVQRAVRCLSPTPIRRPAQPRVCSACRPITAVFSANTR